jgi:hypothetical protein
VKKKYDSVSKNKYGFIPTGPVVEISQKKKISHGYDVIIIMRRLG